MASRAVGRLVPRRCLQASGAALAGAGPVSPSRWVSQGLQAMDAVETAERLRLAALLASLRSVRGHVSAGGEAPLLEEGGAFCAESIAPATFPLTAEEGKRLVWALLGGGRLRARCLYGVLEACTACFEASPRVSDVFLESDAARCVVVGDLHGSLGDLVAALGLAGEPDEATTIVFNGDFVDRGADGAEVLAAVCLMRLTFGARVAVNRGNHEDVALSRAYDFEGELVRKYGADGSALLEQCGRLFAAMPVGCVVRTVDAGDTLVVHGGVPRRLPPLDALYGAPREFSVATKHYSIEARADDLLVQDLLWSDPCDLSDADRGVPNAARGGAGSVLGDGALAGWLRREDLVRLVRSHETVSTGAKRTFLGGRLERWTVFSASRYPHGQGLNKAAVLILRGDGVAAPSRWDSNREEEDVFDTSDAPLPVYVASHALALSVVDESRNDPETFETTRGALAGRIRGALDRHKHALVKHLQDDMSLAEAAQVCADRLGASKAAWKTLLLPALSSTVSSDTVAENVAAAREVAWATRLRHEALLGAGGANQFTALPRGFATRAVAELRRILKLDPDAVVDLGQFLAAVDDANAALPEDRRIDAHAVWALLAHAAAPSDDASDA